MNTPLYITQIVLGSAALAVGLAGMARRTDVSASSRSVTAYGDIQVGGVNGLVGALLALAGVVFGVSGLLGGPALPMPAAALVAGFGLISVLLAADTATRPAPVAEAANVAIDAGGLAPVVDLRDRSGAPDAAGSPTSHAA